MRAGTEVRPHESPARPSRSDVEKVSSLQPQLAADHVKLVALRSRDVIGGSANRRRL